MKTLFLMAGLALLFLFSSYRLAPLEPVDTVSISIQPPVKPAAKKAKKKKHKRFKKKTHSNAKKGWWWVLATGTLLVFLAVFAILIAIWSAFFPFMFISAPIFGLMFSVGLGLIIFAIVMLSTKGKKREVPAVKIRVFMLILLILSFGLAAFSFLLQLTRLTIFTFLFLFFFAIGAFSVAYLVKIVDKEGPMLSPAAFLVWTISLLVYGGIITGIGIWQSFILQVASFIGFPGWEFFY